MFCLVRFVRLFSSVSSEKFHRKLRKPCGGAPSVKVVVMVSVAAYSTTPPISSNKNICNTQNSSVTLLLRVKIVVNNLFVT